MVYNGPLNLNYIILEEKCGGGFLANKIVYDSVG